MRKGRLLYRHQQTDFTVSSEVIVFFLISMDLKRIPVTNRRVVSHMFSILKVASSSLRLQIGYCD
jgi:hypothetical protein